MLEGSRALPMIAQTLDFTCGAACLASALLAFGHADVTEIQLAEELGTLRAGFTPPENVVAMARAYGYRAEMTLGGSVADLRRAVRQGGIIIVTWWDEDAGHYSVVENLGETQITLMDPWTARHGQTNTLDLDYFLENWKARGSRIIDIRERASLTALPPVEQILS